jgi:predicted MFS family arabinose efflux permease
VWHTVATVAVVLLWLHLRRADDPLVPLSVLHRRTVLTGTTLMACAAGTLISAFLLCSLLLQERLGHSALRTGLEFLPAALATVVTARAAGRVLGSWGSRRVAVLALGVAGAGALALATVADAGTAPVVLALAVLSAGVGRCSWWPAPRRWPAWAAVRPACSRAWPPPPTSSVPEPSSRWRWR